MKILKMDTKKLILNNIHIKFYNHIVLLNESFYFINNYIEKRFHVDPRNLNYKRTLI